MKKTFDELLVQNELDLILGKVQDRCMTKLKSKGYSFNSMNYSDVTQEVLCTVYKAIDKYDSGRSSFATYMERVIDNGIKNCFIRDNRNYNTTLNKAKSMEDEMESTGGACFSRNENNYRIVEFICDIERLDLSPKEKYILSRKLNKYHTKEIAEDLGYTSARVSQLWKQVKDRVKHLV